jgi:hypothetical protein
MNQIEEKSYTLIFAGKKLEPASTEKNMVGFCRRCEAELESLAYHSSEKGWLVSARCHNGHPVLMSYDREWKWLEDLDLEIVKDGGKNEATSISAISQEMLGAVFTRAEIRDMLACQEGRPYTRQNIYRARAKFERFRKLFGIKIEV